MEGAFTSQMSATSSTSRECNNPRTVLTPAFSNDTFLTNNTEYDQDQSSQ
jgi:hypothetical protein